MDENKPIIGGEIHFETALHCAINVVY